MTTDTPWFRAEHRPERHEGEGPTVDLIRRGPPLTGNPELDCWADRGCVYGLSLDQAIVPRDSLTAAIEAARPKQELVRAARTCWTCQHADGANCAIQMTTLDINALDEWISGNCDTYGNPKPTATPCPSFQDRPCS